MSTRTMILRALALVLLLFPALDIRAQSDSLQGGIFFAPNTARRVTVTRNRSLLATFVVPKGTYLSVSYDRQQPASITNGHWEFHGNVELRASAAGDTPEPAARIGEVPPSARSFGPGIQRRISQAPLVLTVQGVDVVIETVEQ